MFPFFQWIQDTRLPVEGDLNFPWSQVTFPIEGNLNLPWSNVAFNWPFSTIENRMPLSGAVNQDIETNWSMDPDDEALNQALFEKAGPWGNQLATMMDTMNAMFEALPQDIEATASPEHQEAVSKFKDLHAKVCQVRSDHRSQRFANAKKTLDAMLAKDPEGVADLIRAYAAHADSVPAEETSTGDGRGRSATAVLPPPEKP